MEKITVVLLLFFCSCNTYKKNSSGVYYKSWNEGSGKKEVKLDADRATFKRLRYKNYAKDKTHVFYKGQLITAADAASFEAIGGFYAKDKYRGYYGGDPVRSSKGQSFRVINDYYSTDGKDVFFKTEVLQVADARAFAFVYSSGEDAWERWATDGHYYYYNQYKLPSQDHTHITLYKKSGGLAKDSRHVYFRDHLLNYNSEGEKIIDTIDAASFEVTGYLQCRDKFGCINVIKGRTSCGK